MIFNEEYDRSLWLILVEHRVNQKYLAEMINNIPYEKWEDIRLLIQQHNNGVVEGNITFSVDNLEYVIMMHNEELSIKMIDKSDDYEEVSEWTFMPMYVNNIDEVRQFTAINLGSYSQTINIDDNRATYFEEYNLVKTPIGSYVRLYCNNDSKAYYTKRVDIKKMPKNMYVHQFSSEQRINRLVRRRKRK